MVERSTYSPSKEITRPSLRIRTESRTDLDKDVSREYYSKIMIILDRVKLKTKSYDEVDGVAKVSGKISLVSSGISEIAKSIFAKHRFQALDLNIIFGEEYRHIELLGKDIRILFTLDEKNRMCNDIKKGVIVGGGWQEENTNGIPLNDALILAKLGEEL
jgi:hypothetical protein